MCSFIVGEDDTVEMAEEAHVNVPSALPQPSALDGGAQVAPRATKKRKRAADNDGQAPHHDTGQQRHQSLQHLMTSHDIMMLLQWFLDD